MERSNKLPDVVSAAPAVLRDTFDSLRDRGRTLTGQIKRDPEVKTAQAAAQSQTAAATDLTEAAVGAAGRAVASDTAAVVEAASATAARTVAFHVRKSFAEQSGPHSDLM